MDTQPTNGRRWIRIASSASAFASIALLTLCGGGAVAQTAAPLKIGLAMPMTGPDAGFGQGMLIGAEQAIADINKAGGISGQKLQLVIQDDASEPKQAIVAARKFASDGVRFVIGHLTSGATAVALPIYDEAGIVALTPAATWAPLTARGAWNVFRLCGNDAQQGALAGNWLADQFQEWPVAILNDKTTFGRALADEAARVLKARGGREALFEGIARGEKDFSALVARMKAARIEAVFYGGLAADAAPLIRAMREAGIGAPLIGSDGLLDKDFAQNAGPGAEGTLMTLASEPRKLPDAKGATAKIARTPETEMFSSRTYAALEVLKAGIEAAKSTDGRKVAEALHGGRLIPTFIGDIAFDAKGDLAKPPYTIEVWRRVPDGRIDYAGHEAAR